MSSVIGSSDPFATRPDRRSVQLRAYIVRGDNEILDVFVDDLSYTGCSVQTDTVLVPGETVLLSVLGRGGGKALVRWYKDRIAGLEFEFEELSRERVQRSAERTPLDAEVTVRRISHLGYRVKIYDASPAGCRCEFVERPEIGERIWVKFDGLESIECKVRWIKNSEAGLEFSRPIYPAVFDLLCEKHRSI